MSATAVEFQELHDAYRSRILRYLTRLVGEHEAEDLVQDVFVKISEGLGNFRGEASPSTWIYRIATNAAYDRLRSWSARNGAAFVLPDSPTSERALEEDEPEAFPDQATASAEAGTMRLETNECIQQFIDRLPGNYRAVIALGDIEGFKSREIARILGVSVATVKIRLHRARQELKKKFEAGCEFYRDERNEFACDRKPSSDRPT